MSFHGRIKPDQQHQSALDLFSAKTLSPTDVAALAIPGENTGTPVTLIQKSSFGLAAHAFIVNPQSGQDGFKDVRIIETKATQNPNQARQKTNEATVEYKSGQGIRNVYALDVNNDQKTDIFILYNNGAGTLLTQQNSSPPIQKDLKYYQLIIDAGKEPKLEVPNKGIDTIFIGPEEDFKIFKEILEKMNEDSIDVELSDDEMSPV